MQRTKQKSYSDSNGYKEFIDALFNRSEEDAIICLKKYPQLMRLYEDSNCRSSRHLLRIPLTEIIKQFQFALTQGYKELIQIFWGMNTFFKDLYTFQLRASQLSLRFVEVLAGFSQMSELQLTAITTEIWENNLALQRHFCGEGSPVENITWLDFVAHFEKAVIDGNDLIAGAIWSRRSQDLKSWYAGTKRKVIQQGASCVVSVAPARTAAIFKASIKLQSDVISTDICEAANALLLSYYHVDQASLPNKDFYEDFVFYLQNERSLYFAAALIQRNPNYWRWFRGEDYLINDENQLVDHFMMLLKANVQAWYLPMWNNQTLQDGIAMLPPEALSELLLAVSHLTDLDFAPSFYLFMHRCALAKAQKRKAESDLLGDEPERKRQKLDVVPVSPDSVALLGLFGDVPSPTPAGHPTERFISF